MKTILVIAALIMLAFISWAAIVGAVAKVGVERYVATPCAAPVIMAYEPLYPSLIAMLNNQPGAYRAIYQCPKE